MTAKRKRGRPASAGVARVTLSLRVSAAERKAWDRAAAALGAELGRPVTLGEWVRMQCDKAIAE